MSYEQVSFDVLSFIKNDNIITSDKDLLWEVIFFSCLINSMVELFVIGGVVAHSVLTIAFPAFCIRIA